MGRTYDLRRLKQVVDIIHVLAHYDLVPGCIGSSRNWWALALYRAIEVIATTAAPFVSTPPRACGTVRPTAVAATSWSSWRSWRRATTPSRLGRWRVSKAV
jgi:hypothetical protein